MPADTAAPAPAARSRLARLGPWQWAGIAGIGLSFLAAVIEIVRAQREPWLEAVSALLAALGAWLLARRWGGARILPLALLGALAAAIGFAYAWSWAAWPGLGIGVGAAVRWGYAQRKRAWWFTAVLLTAGYLVAASAGLLRCVEGRGLVWVALQGLGSLAAGAGLVWLARRSAAKPAVAAAAGLAGRALVTAGVALPYAALAAMALHHAA